MDIDLLSKMIGELILDHDELSLPGLGTFVAEFVPASFSDRGYTINPPYRKLSFFQRNEVDHILVDFYAHSNNISFEEASIIISHFLNDLKSVLKERKTVVLPGLGRLRATKENNFFFVPDEDLDIYPDGFALGTVSLKNHTQSQAELSSAIGQLSGVLSDTTPSSLARDVAISSEPMISQPQTEETSSVSPATGAESEPATEIEIESAIKAESEPATEMETESAIKAESEQSPQSRLETVAQQEQNPQSHSESAAKAETVPASGSLCKSEEEKIGVDTEARQTKRPRRLHPALLTLIVLVGTALILLGAFLLLADIAPDFIDSLLYTQEELQILNYPL